MSKIGLISTKNRRKKIYQYDLDGNLINIFESIRDAQEKTNIKMNSIKGAKVKEIPKLKGYLWSDKERNFDKNILKIAKLTFSDKMKGRSFNKGRKRSVEVKQVAAKKLYKPILQYDLSDNFIREWESATVAAKELNLKRYNIYYALKGSNMSAEGFKWKHKTMNKLNKK